jgi:hypothetical protein
MHGSQNNVALTLEIKIQDLQHSPFFLPTPHFPCSLEYEIAYGDVDQKSNEKLFYGKTITK